jgi:AcrR family transcriptional regulator
MDNSSSPSSTGYRILEAGREIFSECGFQEAAVRKICERAGVNLAVTTSS